MAHLVCALSLVVLYILQSAIVSQSAFVAGTADLILLFFAAWSLQERVRKTTWIWVLVAGYLISRVSAMPFYAPLIGYLGVAAFSRLIQRRVWQAPTMAMVIVTVLGTLFQQVIYVIVLQITGAPISWGQSLDTVILPSVLLNLIFALPIYAVVNELVGRIFPLEVDA